MSIIHNSNTPRELNTKAYTMTLKEEEALNWWLDE